MELSKKIANDLDFPISDKEILRTSKILKNRKASSSDLVKNEMIKASCGSLLNVYEKLFNIILKARIYPNTWCEGLITPIFKSGDKSDPGNYRGICVSSCLGKFFSSIINQRLVDFLEKKKTLYPSQIGFLKENRPADHIFTLHTLTEKYSYHHNQKIYACFVDFKKAFDSVWHECLFYRILSYGIGGNIYSLIKSLYSKTTCSIKINKSKTDAFQYQRGFR